MAQSISDFAEVLGRRKPYYREYFIGSNRLLNSCWRWYIFNLQGAIKQPESVADVLGMLTQRAEYLRSSRHSEFHNEGKPKMSFDWSKERNLASDQICEGVRVSTGVVATYPLGGGRMTYIETFIFSDRPHIIRGQQVVNYPRNPVAALRAHAHIVSNLKAIMREGI